MKGMEKTENGTLHVDDMRSFHCRLDRMYGNTSGAGKVFCNIERRKASFDAENDSHVRGRCTLG